MDDPIYEDEWERERYGGPRKGEPPPEIQPQERFANELRESDDRFKRVANKRFVKELREFEAREAEALTVRRNSLGYKVKKGFGSVLAFLGMILILPMSLGGLWIYVWSIMMAAKVSAELTFFTIAVPVISQFYWMVRTGWSSYTIVTLCILVSALVGMCCASFGTSITDNADKNR